MATRIAVIDLGTNSVRFDVHELKKGESPQLLHREKLMVRLGERVFTDGKLHRDAVRRTLQAFSSFKHTAADLKVNKILAFGTSALREASDSARLLKGIRDEMGIDVRVISGREEAELIAAGVLAHERSLKGSFALVDIGGGSTEISICRNGKVLHSESFSVGAARMQQVFLKTIPPAPRVSRKFPGAIDVMRGHIQSVLVTKMVSEEWPQVSRIIGSSGTIKALSRLFRKHTGSKLIEREPLRRLVKGISRMTLQQIVEIPGMDPKRVDLILAGAIILEECMDVVGATKVRFTDYSLRDGLLERELKRMRLEAYWQRDSDLSTILSRAARFGTKELRLKRLVGIADDLFVKLAPLHRLEKKWLRYLKIAVMYRTAGRAISPIRHGQHSYYIVKNVELPLSEEWETELIAQLCLHHETGKPEVEELPFVKERGQAIGRVFVKLLSMLRLIDALDLVKHHKQIVPRRVRMRNKVVYLGLPKGEWTELAALRLQQKRDLFEKVFSVELLSETVPS